ncbi:TPA: hypothetical protein ACH3X2_005315 [Trebouxia sp. C0005]
MRAVHIDSSEWYGLPGSANGSSGSADGSSGSDAEAPLPISITMHPDVSLAAAILSSTTQGNDAAAATTPVEDTCEPYAELPAVIMQCATEDWALDHLEQRSRALLDITNSRLWHPPASPLPGMMADLQAAMNADNYSDMPGLVHSHEKDKFAALASPLLAMMAEVQLAEESTPPASEAGSQFSFPSSAFASTDLSVLGEETTAEPMLSFEKPGLMEFKYQLQTQKDTSDWQFSSGLFLHYATQYGPFQTDATSDNEGRNALCPNLGAQPTATLSIHRLGRASGAILALMR